MFCRNAEIVPQRQIFLSARIQNKTRLIFLRYHLGEAQPHGSYKLVSLDFLYINYQYDQILDFCLCTHLGRLRGVTLLGVHPNTQSLRCARVGRLLLLSPDEGPSSPTFAPQVWAASTSSAYSLFDLLSCNLESTHMLFE